MEEIITIMEQAARAGGEVQMRYFRTDNATAVKTSHQNLVSEADTATQAAIQQEIIQRMQASGYMAEEIGFIGEEQLDVQGKYLFVIDPIDGTHNFLAGLDDFCVSIGCFEAGVLRAGVVYQTIHDRLYSVARGQGVTKIMGNDRKRLTMVPAELKDSLLMVEAHTPERWSLLQQLQDMFPLVRTYRMFGPAALSLARFADNQVQVGCIKGAGIWDIAAGVVLVRECRGWIGDMQGGELVFDLHDVDKTYDVLFCQPQHRETLVTLVK
jgi:myo-inositol-1(or 4)-monophosphatase